MRHPIDRREFLKLAGLGGVVFASSLGAARAAGTMAAAKGGTYDDFYFVQLSDTHWGFQGPPNPDAKGTLKKAVAAVNSMSEQPDFIVFTGDLTHTTDDPKERRQRLVMKRKLRSFLNAVRFLARSMADIVLVNMEDLWQETLPQNVPATTNEARPNWRRRMRPSIEQIRKMAGLAEVLTDVFAHRSRPVSL